MTSPARSQGRRWQIRLGVLLVVPVVCALAFAGLSLSTRVSPEERLKEEYRWTYNPIPKRFWPRDGAWVRPGDPLLKVANVFTVVGTSDRYARSYLITNRGTIQDAYHYADDGGGTDSEGYPARAEGFAQLPTLLQKLPPSDPSPPLRNTLYIAFQRDGAWVVREYRANRLFPEAQALAEALGVRGTGGKPGFW